MTKAFKTVEILMATYNGAPYLTEQLQSIWEQTYPAWHLTVSDDGSSDETVPVLDAFQKQHPEKINRVVSGKRFGNARDHFFWLLKNCDADYICFCDQDDVWKPDKIAHSMDAMLRAERANAPGTPLLVFSDLCVVDEKLNLISESIMYLQQQKADIADYRELLFKNVVNGNTMLINRPLARLSLECTAPQDTMMHDWWIAITAARFGKALFLKEQTVLYRQHTNNDVGAQKARGLAFILSKIVHFTEFQSVLDRKAKQAAVFYDTFSCRMTADERRLIHAYACRRMSLRQKLQYMPFLTSISRKIGFFLTW